MAEKKLVRATMKETLMSDLGRLERGRSYEIPEDRLAAWEKAGLAAKDDGKSAAAGEADASKGSKGSKKEKKSAEGGKE
ncbi:MAG: hypothetical protein K6G18_06095 [Treponema sp.]|nr:hypothetical protein [Treponema sp.]